MLKCGRVPGVEVWSFFLMCGLPQKTFRRSTGLRLILVRSNSSREFLAAVFFLVGVVPESR